MIPHEVWLLSSTFFLSLLGLALNRAHLLSALLCLEGMMLSIYIGMGLWAMEVSALFSILTLAVLAMTACEAALGLALMIATARSQGSDNLNALNLLQC